jgi:hypothetical protein
MAALTRSNIPAAINTYEELIGWALMALKSMVGNEDVNIQYNAQPERRVSVSTIVGQDGRDYIQGVVYLPYSFNEINSPTAKPWKAVNDMSTAQPHVNFNTD